MKVVKIKMMEEGSGRTRQKACTKNVRISYSSVTDCDLDSGHLVDVYPIFSAAGHSALAS